MQDNNFQNCVKCTLCTAYCPMAAVNPIYIGPKQAGPDGERYRLKDKAFYDYALKYCLNCKRCEGACPSGVRIGDIIAKAKLESGQFRPGLREMILANTDIMGTLAVPFSPIINPVLKWDISKKLMDGVLGIDHRRAFPEYAGQTFTRWYKKHAKKQQDAHNADLFILNYLANERGDETCWLVTDDYGLRNEAGDNVEANVETLALRRLLGI